MRHGLQRITPITGLAINLGLAHSVSAEHLGEAATIPASNLLQFRMQNHHSWENYNADSWSNAGLIQSVVIQTLLSQHPTLSQIAKPPIEQEFYYANQERL